MRADWKIMATAIAMTIIACTILFMPQLAKGDIERQGSVYGVLREDRNVGSKDHQISMGSLSSQREIVKLPPLDSGEVEGLLASQQICRMALNDVPQPYIIAMDYVYMDGRLYFHFAGYGRKMDLIKRDPNVSVMIDNFCDGVRDFETIMLIGQLEMVTDSVESSRAAKALVDTADARGGENNLAARHGLKSLDTGALTSLPSTLYRLNVSDYIALKSPDYGYS